MATQETYTFASADGYSTIHARKWLPDTEPVAVLQLVHGMVEYIERYDAFAQFMNSKGFVVVGHDHIGHGHSVQSDDELGIMRGEHPSDIMVEDILTNYNLTKEAYPNVPYFILGHSMGSYMLRKFLSAKADDTKGLAGAIVMGTGTEADATISMGLFMLGVLAKFKGWNYRSTMMRDMTYSAPYKQYDVTGADSANSWLTKDEEIVKKYYSDPFCTYTFSLSGYKGLVESTKYDNNQKNIEMIRKDLPILFTSGAADPVGNMGKGVRAAYDKFKAAGITDLSIKLYDGDRHEILNELDRATVYEDIAAWLASKM